MRVPSELPERYFGELRRTPLLTHAQEVELARGIEAGRTARRALDAGATDPGLSETARAGEAAFERFMAANQRLVVSIAVRYRRPGVDLADLVQEGNVGLQRAVEGFDWRRGHRFSTYATWWIRKAIQRGVAVAEHVIGLPVALHDATVRIRVASARLEVSTGLAPTEEELAAATDLPLDRVRRALASQHQMVSLNAPVTADVGSDELGTLALVAEDRPDDEALARIAAREVREAASRCLDPRSRLVLARRYGLAGSPPMQLDEIGEEIGRSRETVRLILRDALAALRSELEGAA